jgi:hypothetical protein
MGIEGNGLAAILAEEKHLLQQCGDLRNDYAVTSRLLDSVNQDFGKKTYFSTGLAIPPQCVGTDSCAGPGSCLFVSVTDSKATLSHPNRQSQKLLPLVREQQSHSFVVLQLNLV